MLTTSDSPWILTKKALVSRSNVEDFCSVELIRIAHDENTRQGSISITIKTRIANQNSIPRKLTLNIPPESVKNCGFARRSSDELCSARFIHIVPGGAASVSDVSTISLELKKVGTVVCPSETEYIRPANHGDTTFDTFDLDSMPHDNDRQKKPRASSPQPMDSTTEPDTPSTLPPSPSIHPTHFTPAFSLTSLERKPSRLSDGEAREVIHRWGYGHLLAKPNDVDSDLPSEPDKVGFTKLKLIKGRDLEPHIDNVVRRYLPNIVDDIVERARDQISDECKANEAEFRERVEDGNSEVRIMADQCIEEIEEAVQRHIHGLDEQVQQYMNDIEEKGIETMEKMPSTGPMLLPGPRLVASQALVMSWAVMPGAAPSRYGTRLMSFHIVVAHFDSF
ncbi:unnamed protein product [Aspergillus oryzae]|nr:unnamed protein product [Aspergillus oryzae]